MAITFEDVYDGVRGAWTLQGGKSYTVEVLVESGDPAGPDAVLTASGLKIGSTYRWPLFDTAIETNPTLYLQSVACDPVGDDGRSYRLKVQYGLTDPSQNGFDPADGTYDPFAVPPTFRAYSEDEEFFPMVDNAGAPIVNSAGDYMSNVSRPVPVTTFEIGVTVPSFSWASIKAVKHHVNDAEWQGFPAGSVYLADVNPEWVWDERAGIRKWVVTYVLKVKEPILKTYDEEEIVILPGWTLFVLDAGLRELVGGKRTPILSEGVPTSEPLPLKADGTKVLPGEDFHYLTFDVIPAADFSTLPIPSGIFA